MNNLILSKSDQLTMSSADLYLIVCGAREQHEETKPRINDFHARVVDELEGEHYESFVVRNPNKTNSTFYNLTIDQCMLVGMRESKSVRRSVLAKIKQLEHNKTPQLPASFADALQLAADQAKQLELAAPKIEFVDKYVASEGNKTFREVAKILKANERRFREFLSSANIMYTVSGSWVPYQNHTDAGRFYVTTGTANEHAFTAAKFTPKGVEWVSRLWREEELKA